MMCYFFINASMNLLKRRRCLESIPKMISAIIVITMSFVCANVYGDNKSIPGCVGNQELQKKRSEELQQLLKDHKADANRFTRLLKNGRLENSKVSREVSDRSLNRRKRVGEIFGEGCINSAEDYYAAAQIFTGSGCVADHSYQSYVWFSKADNLGLEDAKKMIAPAVDSYLTQTSKKQLFGSLCVMEKSKKGEACCCLYETETSFPDELRKKYSGYTLKEQHKSLQEKMLPMKLCPNTCGDYLAEVKKGTIPGLW